MMTFSSAWLQSWVLTLLWPLVRVLAVVGSAPLLSHRAVPNRVKLGFGFVLTLVIIPTLPDLPQIEIFSVQGLFLLVQQIVIGVSIGFSMRLILAAVDLAGHLIGTTMGLGFATFFDPQSQGQSMALNQFLVLLTMLVFMSMDGHLMMVTAIAESFQTMPISLDGSNINFMKVSAWGANIFSTGLLLALPVVAALLITNMALGILTRTAPQLNIFGIGFPITLTVGFVVLALALPNMLKPMQNMLEQGLSNMHEIVNTAVDTSTQPKL